MGKINEDLLVEYMNNFYGYGNLKSNFWFVGMEEGGDDNEESINSKLESWEANNKPPLLDKGEWENKYQRTWGGLCKIILNFNNKIEPTLEEVRKFQSQNLGRRDSNNCLLEIFPLPSRSVKDFDYSEWTEIPFLKSRKQYKDELKTKRINRLKKLIEEHNPKFILFYSTTPEYLEYWYDVSNIDKSKFKTVNHNNFKVKFYKSDKTTYIITHHPAYKGLTNGYFKMVANEMKIIIQ